MLNRLSQIFMTLLVAFLVFAVGKITGFFNGHSMEYVLYAITAIAAIGTWNRFGK